MTDYLVLGKSFSKSALSDLSHGERIPSSESSEAEVKRKAHLYKKARGATRLECEGDVCKSGEGRALEAPWVTTTKGLVSRAKERGL